MGDLGTDPELSELHTSRASGFGDPEAAGLVRSGDHCVGTAEALSFRGSRTTSGGVAEAGASMKADSWGSPTQRWAGFVAALGPLLGGLCLWTLHPLCAHQGSRLGLWAGWLDSFWQRVGSGEAGRVGTVFRGSRWVRTLRTHFPEGWEEPC